MRRALLPLAAALLSFPLFAVVMAYPWQLALLTASAIGALIYSTQRTVDNLRTFFVPHGPGATRGSRSWIAPREQEEGSDEQQMDEGRRSHAPEEQRQPAGGETAREKKSS